jgi:hypothetical protein
MRLLILILSALLLPLPTAAQAPSPEQSTGRYTFGWQLEQGSPRPRGASTRGAPVTLDREPSAAFRSLQQPGLSAFERDRRAILAMAGGYRVTFDFLEVVRFDPALRADAPYQSWATEYVFVAEDRGGFIALQHILAMRVLQPDGRISDPMVVRHWRQEWRHEAESLLVYEGANTWAPRAVPAAERAGAWVQSVTQVDDSPRYAARGRWQHAEGVSTWLSDETWRPLPRREFSVRKDYDVLVGTNRHTVTADGWVQEENNLKFSSITKRSLAREYGIARYERIRDYDFGAAERYFKRTEPFWAEVRAAWQEAGQKRFTMRAQSDQAQLFLPFFQRADELDEGAAFDREAARSFVRRTLRETYLAP